MTLDKRLLEILRCPASGQTLHLLKAPQLDTINRNIATGSVKRGDGAPATDALDAGLRTAAADRVYRIADGIPVMLVSETILTPSLAAHGD